MNQTPKKTNFIWQTLVLQNCWPISQPAKFSSKNITQFLLGSRTSMNVFRYDHLRHLLLKMSPLIRTLFHSHLKLQNKIGRYIFYVPPTPPRDPSKLAEWQKRMKALNLTKFKKKRHYYKTIEKAKPIKILFATTTPMYSEIIESAAHLCNMPFHTNRWLCGALTANARYLKDIIKPENSNAEQDNVTKVHFQFLKKYHTNKEVPEKRYAWHQLQKKSKRPTIVIIPDIHNNDMILRETNPLNIPVIGLVNSSSATQITYPIFGNANSVEIVHFFCHFLAVLIAKEVIQQDYKNKSHRIFAKTRWLLQKDSIKIPRNFFKDRQTGLPTRRSPRLQKKNHSKGKSKINFLEKKRLTVRKQNVKARIWKKKIKILKKRKIMSSRFYHMKNEWWTRHRKTTQRKRRLMKFISKKFFYKQFDVKKKKIYGRIHFHKRKLRKTRKRINKVIGHRFFVQKNTQRLIFNRRYYPSMRNWRASAWTTLMMTFKLLFLFQHPNLNKKKISKFFKHNYGLTYLAYSFLQQSSKTRSQDSRKALFFEFYLNKKNNKSIPFSLPAWKQELLTTNESIWRNAYGTYFRTQDKKKRSNTFSRSRIKHKKNKRKFRGKIRLVRINKPYNWRSTKTLVTKHSIKSLTRLWTKTRHRIYRDIRNEFWTQVAWYFDKKKRRKFWVQWRMHKELQKLGRRVRLPNKYKSRWYHKTKNWKKNNRYTKNPKWMKNLQVASKVTSTPWGKHKQNKMPQIQPNVARKTQKWLKKDQLSK